MKPLAGDTEHSERVPGRTLLKIDIAVWTEELCTYSSHFVLVENTELYENQHNPV